MSRDESNDDLREERVEQEERSEVRRDSESDSDIGSQDRRREDGDAHHDA